MTREISELMDGELSSETMQNLIRRMKQDQRLREDWSLYHLIGDKLREIGVYSPALAGRVGERLVQEPTVLAPRRRMLTETLGRFAMTAAASLAAIAVVAWVALHGPQERPAAEVASAPPTIAQPAVQVAAPVQPVSTPMPSRVNDYLIAHQEYSPTTAVQGVASYVRSVSHPVQDAGR